MCGVLPVGFCRMRSSLQLHLYSASQNHILLLSFLLLPSRMENQWRQKSDLCPEFSRTVCMKTRSFKLLDLLSPKTHKRVNFGHLGGSNSFICSTSCSRFLPLLRRAACLSWRLRTLCLEEWRAGQSGAAGSIRVPQCPPWRSSGLNSEG